MVTFKPFQTGVLYGDESSYGVGATTNTAIGKVTSFSPNASNNFLKTRGIGGGRDVVSTIYGVFDLSFSLSWEVSDFTFLKYAIGLLGGAGASGDKYTLTEADTIGYTASDILTFGLEVSSEAGTTDDKDVYSGCTINNFTLNMTQGAVLTCNANCLAKTVTSSASGATGYTAVTINPWVFQQGTLKWGATPSTVAKIESCSISFAQNLYVYRSLGDRFIQQPEAGLRDYTFSLTAVMTDTIATTLRDNFYGQANSPTTGIDPASPTADYELWLDFAEGTGTGD